MPKAISVGKGPDDPLQGEPFLNRKILGDINIVIQIDKLMISYPGINSQGGQDKKGACYCFPVELRHSTLEDWLGQWAVSEITPHPQLCLSKIGSWEPFPQFPPLKQTSFRRQPFSWEP